VEFKIQVEVPAHPTCSHNDVLPIYTVYEYLNDVAGLDIRIGHQKGH
jgi:hypothetical protein